MKKMKVAVMTGLNKIEFQERIVPEPKRDEVLVKLEAVGICGSDMHYYETGRIGDYVVTTPFVLGHECAGIVVKTGEDVKHLKEGDRVALEPGKTCKTCSSCRQGLYNLCPDVVFFATPPYDGVFQEYVAHEADLCFKLPDNVTAEEGALVEPLAIGFHAANKGKAQVGQTAVVFGAGCIGLVSVLALKARGVTQVFIVDSMDKRLSKAIESGANVAINFKKENVVEKIMALTEGAGVDLVIETSGSEIAANQSIEICSNGATIVFVGYSHSGKMNLDMSNAINKELSFESIFRYRHIYPMTIQAIAAGNVNVKNLVSHTFDFDKLPEAMDQCINSKDEIVKAVVKM